MNMFLFLAQYNSLMLSFCWPALAYQIGYTCLPFHILHSQTQSDLLPLPCSNPWHQPLLDCLFFCGHSQGLPGGSLVKNLPPMQEMQETKFWSLGWENPLEKEMATHSSILAGESHGQRSLVGYSPWICKPLNKTERILLVLWSICSSRFFPFSMKRAQRVLKELAPVMR